MASNTISLLCSWSKAGIRTLLSWSITRQALPLFVISKEYKCFNAQSLKYQGLENANKANNLDDFKIDYGFQTK